MSEQLVTGPHRRERHDSLGAKPGYYVVLAGSGGPEWLQVPLTAGEMRYGRHQEYYLVACRSGQRPVSLLAAARDTRDEFSIAAAFDVAITDPISVFREFGVGKDPLEAIELQLGSRIIEAAGLREWHELRDLQTDLKQMSLAAEVPFAEVRMLKVLVQLSEDTRRRRGQDIELQDQKVALRHERDLARTRAKMETELELLRQSGKHEVITESLKQRKDRIAMLAEDFQVALDPLLLHMLAAGGAPSADMLAAVRNQLRGERHHDNKQFAELLIALSEANLLEERHHEAMLRFLQNQAMGSGVPGLPGGPRLLLSDMDQPLLDAGADGIDSERETEADPDSTPDFDEDGGAEKD